ncbi:hypothetical protein KQX54_020675 [Cotesia glomerata]|uniref:Uncharacterized protein n=1 Tax=Cotesia glomerata TaxID=32391 RepID=A0AAV7I0C2_COTGL|nr:hypothetical protein KQX54_020675 [Cotesia glomerata]
MAERRLRSARAYYAQECTIDTRIGITIISIVPVLVMVMLLSVYVVYSSSVISKDTKEEEQEEESKKTYVYVPRSSNGKPLKVLSNKLAALRTVNSQCTELRFYNYYCTCNPSPRLDRRSSGLFAGHVTDRREFGTTRCNSVISARN